MKCCWILELFKGTGQDCEGTIAGISGRIAYVKKVRMCLLGIPGYRLVVSSKANQRQIFGPPKMIPPFRSLDFWRIHKRYDRTFVKKSARDVEVEPLRGASMSYERAAFNRRHIVLQNSVISPTGKVPRFWLIWQAAKLI